MTEPSKPKLRTTVYIESNIWKEFQTICKRENHSASQKIEEMIARHVAVHGAGNPNLLLEQFMGKPEKECFRCQTLKQPLVRVRFVSGLIAEVCPGCLQSDQNRGLVKGVYGSE